jgi:phosphotriesterase-related protein
MKRTFGAVLAIFLLTVLMSSPAIAGKVMGVLGPIDGNKLGPTLIHEHMAFGYLSWFADESVVPYDRKKIEAKVLKDLKAAKALGVKTVIDAGMADVGGRDPILLKNLAQKSGVNIIMCTGLYWQGEGGSKYYTFLKAMGRNIEDDMYELFKKEITVGVGKTKIKAGCIKLASSDPKVTDYEKIVFKAGVRAAKDFDLPIITHNQGPNGAHLDQQEVFLSLGANPKRIMIGHQNDSIDVNYHLSQLEKPDFFIGFDRTSLRDPKAEDCVIELVKKGHANRICLGHDSIGWWLGRPFAFPPRYANWHPTYIHKKFIPKMKEAGVTDDQIKTMLVDNPRRLLTGE